MPPAPPRPAASNPFAGIDVRDIVLDVAALLMLFAALALLWDASGEASDRWWVVIATLFAAAAVAVPYILKSGLVPRWEAPQARLTKIALVAPYAVSVFVALVNELVHLGAIFEGGVGPAVAMGLAGALLAATPRAADDVPGPGDRTWWTATKALGWAGLVAMAATWLVWLVRDLVGDGFLLDDPALLMAHIFGVGAILVVAIALPMLSGFRPSGSWLRVFQTVAFTIVAVNLFAGEGDGAFSSTGLEKLQMPLFGVFLVVGAAAASLARPVRRLVGAADDVTSWVDTAARALLVAVLGIAMVGVTDILVMLSEGDFVAGRIVPLVVTFLVVGAGIFALSKLDGDADRSRLVVLAVLAGIAIAGIIVAAVQHGETGAQVSGVQAAFWFALPALSAWALLVPAAIRRTFTPLSTSSPARAGQDATTAS